jgi:predicted exporter
LSDLKPVSHCLSSCIYGCLCDIQEALKLTADLRKRKQDLLQKQLTQQKLLIGRLENSGVAPEQREVLMATIKKLQVSHVAICMGNTRLRFRPLLPSTVFVVTSHAYK